MEVLAMTPTVSILHPLLLASVPLWARYDDPNPS
jgi:hypothetical protein